MIRVTVVYAQAERQDLREVDIEGSATVEDAIRASGLLESHPEIDLGTVNRVGRFGQLAQLNARLCAGDRVEIYRPLQADPKEARRARVLKARKKK
jgi:putative ubiquitin-RnfH superfamily antitoxin RatB of RatAB toxin-antitoxin module